MTTCIKCVAVWGMWCATMIGAVLLNGDAAERPRATRVRLGKEPSRVDELDTLGSSEFREAAVRTRTGWYAGEVEAGRFLSYTRPLREGRGMSMWVLVRSLDTEGRPVHGIACRTIEFRERTRVLRHSEFQVGAAGTRQSCPNLVTSLSELSDALSEGGDPTAPWFKPCSSPPYEEWSDSSLWSDLVKTLGKCRRTQGVALLEASREPLGELLRGFSTGLEAASLLTLLENLSDVQPILRALSPDIEKRRLVESGHILARYGGRRFSRELLLRAPTSLLAGVKSGLHEPLSGKDIEVLATCFRERLSCDRLRMLLAIIQHGWTEEANRHRLYDALASIQERADDPDMCSLRYRAMWKARPGSFVQHIRRVLSRRPPPRLALEGLMASRIAAQDAQVAQAVRDASTATGPAMSAVWAELFSRSW